MKILRVIDEDTDAVFIALPLTEARYKDLKDWIDSKTTIKELTKKANKKKPKKTTAKKSTPTDEGPGWISRIKRVWEWSRENLSVRIIFFAIVGLLVLIQIIKGLFF